MNTVFGHYEAILKAAAEGIYGIDSDGGITFANSSAERLTGWPRHEQMGQLAHTLIHHTHADGRPYPQDQCPIYETLKNGVISRGEEFFWHKDGTSFPVVFTSAPVRDETGDITGAVVTFSDQSTHRMGRRYRALVEAISDITWVCDPEGAILDIHGRWIELMGLSRSEVIGWGWRKALHPQDRDKYLMERFRSIEKKETFEREVRYIVADGSVKWFLNRVVPVEDEEGRILEWVGVGREITEKKKQEQKLQRRAEYDHLTGALNRWSFKERLSRSIDKAQQYHETFSLILFDVDHFKSINDIYGHDVGDQVLKSLADNTGTLVRKGDYLSRWGGEEFIILLPDTELKEAISLAQRLNQNIAGYHYPGPGHITISAGVAEYLPNETEEAVIHRVDGALYQAKNNGRNQVICDSVEAHSD